MSRDAGVLRGVADAARTTGRFSDMKGCDSIDQLLTALEHNGTSALVVDVEDHPRETLGELESVIERFPGTRVVVVATEQRPEWMIDAMRAGARHFLAKASLDTELPGVLGQLATAQPAVQQTSTGTVISVMSAGGGCGATTLAVNLAEECRRLSRGTSLIVDLDTAWGGVAGYLDVSARYGVADVLADARRIDPELIRSTAARYSEHLHVLASPAAIPLQEVNALPYERLDRTLRNARQAYDFTVVDAPGLPGEVAVNLARSSDLTIMVLEANIEDIRIARRRIKTIFDRGVGRDRILAIVNRFSRRRASLPSSEVKRALEFVRLSYVSNDYRSVASCINFGKPLAEVAPRSRVRRDIQRLAKSIHKAASSGRHFGEVK